MIARIGFLALALPLTMGLMIVPTKYLDYGFDSKQAESPANFAKIKDATGHDVAPTVDTGTRPYLKSGIINDAGCLSKPSCLRVSMGPSAPGAAKNKIFYSMWSHYKDLDKGEGARIRLGDNKPLSFSFAMKFDGVYDTPPHQLINFQLFQANPDKLKVNGVEAGGPILSLRTVPISRRHDKSANVQEVFAAVRSPEAGSHYYYDMRDKNVFYFGSVKKGEWNRFTFDILSQKKNGQMVGTIRISVNGKLAGTYEGLFGFVPENGIWDALGAELGIYRSADASGNQTVFFDDVNITRSPLVRNFSTGSGQPATMFQSFR